MILISDGRIIPGPDITQAVLRSDSTPIPVTLEATIRGTVAVGGEIEANGLPLTVVKTRTVPGQDQQGHETSATKVTAILAALKDVAAPARDAVILEGRTLSAAYQRLGYAGALANAPSVPRFAVLKGQFPTPALAQAAYEAGGMIRFNRRLEFLRLDDAMQAKPVAEYPDTVVVRQAGDLDAEDDIPSAFSLSPTGASIGRASPRRCPKFLPHHDSIALHTMSRALVLAGTIKVTLSPRICAGDAVQVMGTTYVVITAAHVFEQASQYTKLWLGRVA